MQNQFYSLAGQNVVDLTQPQQQFAPLQQPQFLQQYQIQPVLSSNLQPHQAMQNRPTQAQLPHFASPHLQQPSALQQVNQTPQMHLAQQQFQQQLLQQQMLQQQQQQQQQQMMQKHQQQVREQQQLQQQMAMKQREQDQQQKYQMLQKQEQQRQQQMQQFQLQQLQAGQQSQQAMQQQQMLQLQFQQSQHQLLRNGVTPINVESFPTANASNAMTQSVQFPQQQALPQPKPFTLTNDDFREFQLRQYLDYLENLKPQLLSALNQKQHNEKLKRKCQEIVHWLESQQHPHQQSLSSRLTTAKAYESWITSFTDIKADLIPSLDREWKDYQCDPDVIEVVSETIARSPYVFGSKFPSDQFRDCYWLNST